MYFHSKLIIVTALCTLKIFKINIISHPDSNGTCFIFDSSFLIFNSYETR